MYKYFADQLQMCLALCYSQNAINWFITGQSYSPSLISYILILVHFYNTCYIQF